MLARLFKKTEARHRLVDRDFQLQDVVRETLEPADGSGEPDDSDWRGARGFVAEHMTELLGERIPDHHVYMCGPPPMIDSAEKIVRQAGVNPADIHFDKFFDRSHTQQRG